jgi:hypothetical protein
MHSAIIEESAFIKAAPSDVYNVLADYRVGHNAVLPKPYFVKMDVLEGGFGAGTLIHVDMEVYGVKRRMRMSVSEPQKGYILQEVDLDTGTETQFIFKPVEGGTHLTIHTKMNFGEGFMGFLEKLTTPAITRGIYKKELANIAAYLQNAPQLA